LTCKAHSSSQRCTSRQHTSRQCTYSGRGNGGLFCRYTGLFCGDVGLVYGDQGLFCGGVELFRGGIGLFCTRTRSQHLVVVHPTCLTTPSSSMCILRFFYSDTCLFWGDTGPFSSDVGLFFTISVVRQRCILYTYIYLCLYAYCTTSLVCSTLMYLMSSNVFDELTLNTMQHTALRDLHLAGDILQHTATYCNTL